MPLPEPIDSMRGRHVVVLGASSGLGAATAVHLASRGARLTLLARRRDRLEEIRERCPGDGHRAYAVDATRTDELSQVFESAHREAGSASGLVHSIGIGTIRPLAVLKPEFVGHMFAVNVTTALMATRLLLGKLKAPRGASIVWISSVQADVATGAGAAVYAATKGALNAAMRVCALELAPRGVRVNALNVGMVRTEIWDSQILDPSQKDRIAARHPLGEGRPEDVAYAVRFLLSDESRWITGSTMTVDGGYGCHNSPSE